MVAVDLPNARRLAFSVVAGQAAITLIFALASLAIAGSTAALSALIGGGIGTLASLVMALIAFGRNAGMDAQRVMRAFYVGEAAKLGLVVVLFVVVLKAMKVSPGALFGAYVATFFVYWIALANALPPLGGRPPPGRKN
ncbi:MAG TPA: ATP synthase subunit I [Steroidobacteraceae bacterium]|nr:ATP synthase subunit I [Steroidobacteraceae bacterium]